MGQQLFKVDFQSIDLNDVQLNSTDILLDNEQENILFFFPNQTDETMINNAEQLFSDKIHQQLFRLTHSNELDKIHTDINRILSNEVYPSINNDYKKVIQQLKFTLENQHQLCTFLSHKFEDKSIEDDIEQQTSVDNNQFPYFAIQSSISVLLLLIKSVEKIDPIIIPQTITLISQLCEQLPIEFSSVQFDTNLLFQSLQPIRDYFHELSLRNDPIIAITAIQILLKLSIAQCSFKEMLPLLARLIFDTETIYDVRCLFIQLNKIMPTMITLQGEWSNFKRIDKAIEFLESIGVYPNTQLMKLNKKMFTGQFIAAIILTHIDINQIDVNQQINYDLVQNSFSFEFHPNTFEILSNIITQLNTILKKDSKSIIISMLIVCLRLFTTHLKYLSASQLNLHRDLFPESSQKNFDLNKFVTEEQLINWFELLLDLSYGQKEVSEEASKAFIYLLDLRLPSFTEKLSFIHRYVVENKYPILNNQLIFELHKNENLLCWIAILSDENNNHKGLKILESFIEICFNPPEQRDKEQITQIEKMLLLFQHLLICQLFLPTNDHSVNRSTNVPSSVVIQYLIYLFRYNLRITKNILFKSTLVGLCLMTKVNELFDFTTVQPIFAAILPLLVNYILHMLTKKRFISNYYDLISWLIAKMTSILISGLPLDSLEIKYMEKLQSTIFTGGYRKSTSEKSTYLSNLLDSNLAKYSEFKLDFHTDESTSDNEFLMSVFNNSEEGARLITKMKMFIKENQYSLQPSIEEQANNLVSIMYAVYIKYFDRINLAKFEVIQTNQQHTYSHLLSIFKYANHVRTVLGTIKASGGNCEEFYQQVKKNALFLLLSMNKSDSIPIITEDTPSPVIELLVTQPHHRQFQRQVSRWSKAKHVLKLLRHLMQACIRFKKLMHKKQARQKRVDAETLLSRAIDQFIYKEKDFELDEIIKCLDRQYERAITRLITYRFIEKFMQDVVQLKNNNNNQSRVLTTLAILLPMLRKSKLKWSYCENISAVDFYLRKAIRKSYFSIFDTILPNLSSSQSNTFIQILFNHFNFQYTSDDLLILLHYQIPRKCFSLIDAHSDRTKFFAYNWFRLFTVNLCQNIQLDQTKGKFQPILEQQRDLLFRSFIQSQLELIETTNTDEEEKQEHLPESFKDLPYSWFHYLFIRDVSTGISSKFEKELWINQYLFLLLRCFHFDVHLRTICATLSYIERLLNIYHQSRSKITRLLSLKILRQLIPYLPKHTNDGSKILIEEFLIEILHSINASFSSSQQLPAELVTELIYLYRTVVSCWSPWQLMAINFIFNSITSHLNLTSFQSNDTLIASLCILGGYIDHVSLGSIVRVTTDQEINYESRLAMVIEINSDSSICSIQYFDGNQIQSKTIDQLQVVVQVTPPNLLSLPTVDVSIDSIFDAFGHFLQLKPIASESLKFLQMKRRSLSALNHLLQYQKMVEIFMSKSYASLIAQLSMPESLTTSTNLTYLNKKLLEQYSLHLDMCQHSQPVSNDHRSIVVALSTPISKYNGWKSFASKTEIQMWKQGRTGNDKIKLIPFPISAVKPEVFETCGQNHQFKGRIVLKQGYSHVKYPTFTVENIQLTEGKWYFCVKLLTRDIIQIGWATQGFTAERVHKFGLGDDKYSWSYDVLCRVFLNDGIEGDQSNDIRWRKNDVCGCGIDIDGKNTNIKYWLNGKLLDAAFKHLEFIPQSDTKCNLLPHGRATTFFPGVSLLNRDSSTNSCELIFSPEDMQQCPLPIGYKPVLLPTLVHTENSLVAYPSHAYVVGDISKDYVYTSRTMPSTLLLRDFVNKDHFAVRFQIDEYGVILSEDSEGFPLTIERDVSCFSITYDFQLLQTANEMETITLVMTNSFSIEIPLTNFNQITRVIMVGNINEQQLKVYWDNQNQTYQTRFPNETTNLLTLYHLSKIAARLKNIAIWNYALPEDHIHRLFTYGLFYIATDYQQLEEHRKRMNTFSFIDKQFSDEYLIPFDEPFDEDIWQRKKNQADQNEEKYFSKEESSTIELIGNKSYLVLEKPIEQWSEYTIILDVSIVNWPINGKEWSLIQLNDMSKISITHEGKICLKSEVTEEKSQLTLNLNEYYRLCIIVKETSCQIFTNGQLQIDMKVKDAQFIAESNRFYLFQENDILEETSYENTLRIRCQSITLLNRSMPIDERIKTPNFSLQSLVTPPLSIIVPSLIAIGHQLEWIKYIIEQYKTTNVAMIDRILREQKGQLEKNVLENRNKQFIQILSALSPTIDQQKLNDLISAEKFFNYDQISNVSRFILTHWNDLQRTELHDLGNEIELNDWIHNPSIIAAESNGGIQVSNRNRRNTQQSLSSSSSSSSSSEDNDDDSSSVSSDRRNDQREDSDEVIVYRLYDLAEEQREKLIYLENQQRAMEDLSSQRYTQSHIYCEQNLITVYARDILLNMLKVWSNQSITLFPLDKFGDWNFVVKLFRVMFYHYTSIKENIDDMSLLILSLLKVEVKQIIEQNLENRTPLLCALQEDIFGQIIQFLLESSSLRNESLKFIWKVLNLFVELIRDKSTMKQNQIDILLPHVFPVPMINLIFKLLQSVEDHQSKIFIVRLFSSLIQISNSFKLNVEIKQFFVTLLHELPSNESIMDVVFLLSEQQAELQYAELPENVPELFKCIHIIIALTDLTKQTVVREELFTEFKDHLNGVQFTRADFNRSNAHFNQIADFQLLDFMDKSQKFKKSPIEFLRTLPEESTPNSIFYQNHPSLSSIPADCVRIRAIVLYILNALIINISSFVDCSLSPGESFLTDQIRKAKMYIFSSKKCQLLDQSILATESGSNHENLSVYFDVLKASLSNENYENTMFYQAYRQLCDKAQDSFRKKDKQLWIAQYIDMHSTDIGGPYRDSITQICSDICSTRLPLFILCPNGRTHSASNQDCWIPNVFPPNKSIPETFQKQYRFVGQLMGLATRKKHYLNVKFAPLLWKELLYEPITIHDIQAIDAQSFTLIHEVEQQIQQAMLFDTDANTFDIFNSVLSEVHFEVVGSAQQTFELIPNGSQIPITAENFSNYSFHYRQYRLNEFHRQIDYIRQGLHSVVPSYYLNIFTAKELEEAVCGKGYIDVELLKRNTTYGDGYNQNAPVIDCFWKVMSEMFTEEQKKMLLVFAWGRSTLPIRDEDFSSKFKICKYHVQSDNIDHTLPRSHTCSFTIDLPEYSTLEIMHERLNCAITYCSNIDGDGNMDAENVNYNDDSSSDDDDDDE
ncbi:hypothetical protein I4U23_005138 [Adineta vaga]|nr:hypothetical protein I4U23_005138 [Adineta vaga]